MTDIGFTGGGAGSGMVYVDGKPDHKMANDKMVDHIVELVEAKAKSIERAESVSALPTRPLARPVPAE
jgi:(E)-4-hydroxy-3-methylbut-2-enyl-diphosphate synthase